MTRRRRRQGLLVTAEERDADRLKRTYDRMAAEREAHVLLYGWVGWQEVKDRRRYERLKARGRLRQQIIPNRDTKAAA